MRKQDISLPFDPAHETLWTTGSDVDWVRGSYIREYEHPMSLLAQNPWIVANEQSARYFVQSSSQMTRNLFGALMSWRICTVSQLNAGLANMPVPEFTRDGANYYGALARLGAINVGFDTSERLSGTPSSQVWLSMGNEKRYVRDVFKLIGAEDWLVQSFNKSNLIANRIHARHNTFASHVGLALAKDARTQLVGGDGWGGFRYIDLQSLQATMGAITQNTAATDIVCLGTNRTLTGIELQFNAHNMRAKVQHWVDLLANSPMSRRGLLCVWLLGREASSGTLAPCQSIFEWASGLPQMMVGTPSVAQRMGWATWEEWFDHGQPTARFGQYHDMLGTTRSMFDADWTRYTPMTRSTQSVQDWGWMVMRRQLQNEWGLDVSQWRMPEHYRGGFYGFTGVPEADDE